MEDGRRPTAALGGATAEGVIALDAFGATGGHAASGLLTNVGGGITRLGLDSDELHDAVAAAAA